MKRDALISLDGLYRYWLLREWDERRPCVMFIGLNPSTADAQVDDATIRKCIRFAQAWGCGSLLMMNLFAFRATDPKVMRVAKDPIGPDNDYWLQAPPRDCSYHRVACWGVNGSHRSRDAVVCKMLPGLFCIRRTKHGCPEHPLYLPGDLKPGQYSFEGLL